MYRERERERERERHMPVLSVAHPYLELQQVLFQGAAPARHERCDIRAAGHPSFFSQQSSVLESI